MNFKNHQVLDIYDQKGKTECVKFLQSQTTSNLDICPVTKTYEKCIEKLINNRKSFLKSKGKPNGEARLESFLQEEFSMPKASPHLRVKKATSDVSLNLKQELRKTDEKLNESIHELDSTVSKLTESESEVNQMNNKLLKTKKELKRTKARETYSREKVQKLEVKLSGQFSEETECSQIEIEKLQNLLMEKDKIISDLQTNCDYLENVINDIDKSDRILNVYGEKSRRYSTELKTCIYELLQCNVSASKLPSVITCVLNLVKITPNQLPSKSTILDFNLQRLCLAQKQIAEVFSKENNTTLLTDETSKFGSKFMGYEAADSTGNLWVLGLRDIETKSSEDTLKVFKEILSDINDIGDKANDEISRDILKHICATLSDRAATEVKFNELLESYRKELLPLIYTNFNSFSQEEKSSLETLCNFFVAYTLL